MVAAGRGSRTGASPFGCLLTLVLAGAVLYYGGHVGMIYWRYYELLDDMQHQATLASQLSDDTIRKTLLAQADSLLGQAPAFRIHRGGRPERITIQTEYSEIVELPLFRHTFVLRPRAEEPL